MPDPMPQPLEEQEGVDAGRFRAEIVPANRPVLLRGLARSWPAVGAAAGSPDEAVSYLARFDRGAEVEAFIAPPGHDGRYFYRPDMAGFNFDKRRGPFSDVVRSIASVAGKPGAPRIYAGAAAIPEVMPGFTRENPLPLAEAFGPVPRLWIGNESLVAPHFDESDNVAVAVAGRRRFTIFPPEQVANLYVGPLDFTMAGQPASMVSLREPDLGRYPRFREALAAAFAAELEPGDAVYIPALWWHGVEATEPFNILVNYWWQAQPPEAGSAFVAMAHAILSISRLPAPQRAAWRAYFDHYVFRPEGEDPAVHLAPEHRGILGEPTSALRRRLRDFLARALSLL
jgi:hypothetical protein